MLQSLSQRPIVLLSGAGNTDLTLNAGEASVLYMTKNRLRFGGFDYILEYVAEDEDRFDAARQEFIQYHVLSNTPTDGLFQKLDALPRQTHHRVRDVIIHGTISSGAFGIVRCGVHARTGDALAIKTMHCKARQVGAVKLEIEIMSGFPSTPGIVPMLDVWCEHGHSPPCLTSRLEDVHISMPLARYDFDHMPWESIDFRSRLELFHQVLQGLSYAHSRGIMHRDISPRNLLVLGMQRPHSAICDWGKAIRSSTDTVTTLGPIHCVAPEVWTASISRPYDNAVDIWSYSYCLLCTFQRPPGFTSNAKNDPGRNAKLISLVEKLCNAGSIDYRLGGLIVEMLALNPQNRPSAEEALTHEVWDVLRGNESPEDGDKQSIDLGPVTPPRDLKRPRMLSPPSIPSTEPPPSD